MPNHSVIIAGAGPTGLMLAAELALAKVDVAVIEKRPDQRLAGSRAGGFHSRTIEILDQRGVAERFLAQGKTQPFLFFSTMTLSLADFPTRHNYLLALFQNKIEKTLAEWVSELNVKIYRSSEVADFKQDAEGVDVVLDDGSKMRAKYLVGCDGGRSVVRKKAAIEFAGWDASVSYLIAEAKMKDEPPAGMFHGEKGVYGVGKIEDGKVRIVLVEKEVMKGHEPSVDELRAALVAYFGKDFGVHDISWLSRFSDASRQAAKYRDRRVLLAGDAAHIHGPPGGQGLNLGMQDAFNLGWKLAQVVKGASNETLLDTYHSERHPIGARVLKLTMAQTALARGDDRSKAVLETLTDIFKLDEPRKRYAGILSGLDIQYDLSNVLGAPGPAGAPGAATHPLVGRRMPDLDLQIRPGPQTQTGSGETKAARVFELLHEAKPVLLNFGRQKNEIAPRPERLKVVDAKCERASWELPAAGEVTAPESVLIRPDGYVAWAGAASDAGLREALAYWFGPFSI